MRDVLVTVLFSSAMAIAVSVIIYKQRVIIGWAAEFAHFARWIKTELISRESTDD